MSQDNVNKDSINERNANVEDKRNIDMGAQPPEPNVTMTSSSPDVVIATIGTSDPKTRLAI